MSQELEEQMMKRAESERQVIGQDPAEPLKYNDESIKIIKTPLQMLQQHEITITFLSKGAIIRVGCKAFAFSSNEEAMNELSKYVEHPESQIKKYQNNE